MLIKAESVGTTAVKIIERLEKKLCDLMIQNLSSNNVYLISSEKAVVGHGIKIAPDCVYTDDASDEELWLIADGASSDVRIGWRYYDPKTRKA